MKDESLKVILKLNNRLFCVKADQVVSMEVLGSVRHIPQAPKYIRGVVELRGQLIPLVDLRVLLGLGSYQEDLSGLVSFLKKGEKEYLDLFSLIKNKLSSTSSITFEEINKSFQFDQDIMTINSDNLFIRESLNIIKKVHEKIIERLKKILSENFTEDKVSAVEELELNEYPRLQETFKSAQSVVTQKNKELFIVVNNAGNNFAITVDHIEAVDLISPVGETNQSIYDFLNDALRELIEGIGKNKRFDDLIICLDAEKLYKHLDLNLMKKE